MANGADEIVDRRRLRRKVTFWRVAAILIAAIAILAAAARFWGSSGGISGDHIAKVRINGTITEDDELLERLESIAESSRVKGVIVSIDSPGGTTAGGEAIFVAVRKIAESKPVVAQVGTLAASAGYMIASATDHIVARQSSIVGSIGVLVQFPEFTGLMDKLGIGVVEIKSSPLKAEPSPFNPTTEEERAMIARMINDSYDWFVDLVTERRPLDRSEVLRLADGSVFTGRQALDNRLVDQLGGEETAKNWLHDQGVDANLKVREWKAKSDNSFFGLLNGSNNLAQLLGFAAGGNEILEKIGAERIFLDGLISVWQPERMGKGGQ